MKIGNIIRASFRHWNSVIDLHFVVFFATACASAFLLGIQALDVLRSELASVASLLSAIFGRAYAGQFAYTLTIGILPFLRSLLMGSFILVAMALHFCAVPSGIFRTPLAGPFGLKAWSRLHITPAIFGETRSAATSSRAPFCEMSVLARFRRDIESLTGNPRGLSFWRGVHVNDFYALAPRGAI